MNLPPYVLVTPVRNEEATVEATIRSVLDQTVLPREWVIASDQSTDATDEIVRRYEKEHSFMRLVRVGHKSGRGFASVVHTTRVGLCALRTLDYDYLGLLDADVRFKPDYYETLMHRFASAPKLGLAGGLVLDLVDGRFQNAHQYLKDVAGATQFFRRECFESLGGLIAIPEGGWDAITCVQARACGFDTATFPDLVMEHLKPRNTAEGSLIRRTWQLGTRDYALGGHPLFELLKCASRAMDPPRVTGALVRFLGFAWCTVLRKERKIPASIVERTRREQLQRLRPKSFNQTIHLTANTRFPK